MSRSTDAGGGAGVWDVAVEPIAATPGASLVVAADVTVPGHARPHARRRPPTAADGDLTGFVRLTRGADVRRIPFWLHVSRPALGGGDRDAARRARAPRRRHPRQAGARLPLPLSRRAGRTASSPPRCRARSRSSASTLTKPVDELRCRRSRAARPGVQVEPRVVAAGDENRLTGYPALPINLNPYLAQFGDPVLAAGAVRPLAGAYDVVFDSADRGRRGSFTFRYWVNDTTPPTLTLAAAARRARHADRGSSRRRRLGGRPRRRSKVDASTAGSAAATSRGTACIADPDGGAQARHAPAAGAGFRLPGVAQHGERGADPAEHAGADATIVVR